MYNQHIMKKNAKNFAIWTALRSMCYFFSTSPSYYGGSEMSKEDIQQKQEFCSQNNIDPHYTWGYCDSDVYKAICMIGIDWEASSVPVSNSVSEFNGTDADSSWKEIVTGVLVLLDGTKIPYYAECVLNMHQFDMMQKFFEQAE